MGKVKTVVETKTPHPISKVYMGDGWYAEVVRMPTEWVDESHPDGRVEPLPLPKEWRVYLRNDDGRSKYQVVDGELDEARVLIGQIKDGLFPEEQAAKAAATATT